MSEKEDSYVKILFRFYSDLLGEWTVETMWAQIVDFEKGYYKIDNTPFYASIASGDIVFAEYDEEEKTLTYRDTIEYSGNSVIQVVILDKAVLTNDIRDLFKNLGCSSEKFAESFFTMEVGAAQKYGPVKEILLELENKGIIAYAEPVLSENHRY